MNCYKWILHTNASICKCIAELGFTGDWWAGGTHSSTNFNADCETKFCFWKEKSTMLWLWNPATKIKWSKAGIELPTLVILLGERSLFVKTLAPEVIRLQEAVMFHSFRRNSFYLLRLWRKVQNKNPIDGATRSQKDTSFIGILRNTKVYEGLKFGTLK